MKILTQRDMQRLEDTVRKVERMEELNRQRRQAIHTSFPEEGNLIFPTGRTTIPTVLGTLTPPEITLTRDDRNIIQWFDQSYAMTLGDIGERIFWLPADPEVGDTFWIATTSGADLMIRMAAFNHALVLPLIYGLWDHGWGIPGELPSSWFNIANEQWERAEWRIGRVTDSSSNPELRLVRTVIIQYIGTTLSRPVSYVDVDGDGWYYNYDPASPQIPLHPLIWGDFKLWSVVWVSNISLYTAAFCIWDFSTDGPFG